MGRKILRNSFSESTSADGSEASSYAPMKVFDLEKINKTRSRMSLKPLPSKGLKSNKKLKRASTSIVGEEITSGRYNFHACNFFSVYEYVSR